MPDSSTQPNVIVIVTDDQGYGDLGCYNPERVRTPNIDEMAAGGARLTDFYAGQPVCGPSRSALMTGCYPNRIEEAFDHDDYHTIPHEDEILIPEILDTAGYATGAVGKWHLAGSGREAVETTEAEDGFEKFESRHENLMPTERGFDSYFGIPYSNDMSPSVLVSDGDVVESPVQQSSLTTRYTDRAVEFIRDNEEGPFFLYLAYNMPHTPVHPPEESKGQSDHGLFADAVEEIDRNVGRILDTLRACNAAENTFITYTSDHGPWIEPERDEGRTPDATESRLQSGSTGPLRGRKMTTWEGGVRVPCVVYWPGTIPDGQVIDEITTNMDLLPTLARLAGAQEPTDRVIDGEDLLPLLTASTEEGPHNTYYYYKHTHLNAVRSGEWKLVCPREATPADLGWYGRLQEEIADPELYNLREDVGEQHDVADEHPDVVDDLLDVADRARTDLGDRDRAGERVRR